jgi:predicted RND superfamily exporter protein
MQKLLGISIRHPIAVILTVLGITVFFCLRIANPFSGEVRLRIDPSFDAILPDDDANRLYYEWVKEEFGDDQSLIIALVVDDVFSLDNLRMIHEVSGLLEEAEGVDYVTSLATANHIRSVSDGIETQPFLEEVPETAEEAERLRAEVQGNPVYAGNLVSPDSRATAFVVYVDDTPEQEFNSRGLDLRMLEIAEEASGGAEAFISGTAYMRAANSRVLRADLLSMLPTVIVIMAAIALFSFRSPRGVAIPLATILLSMLWTLGMMAEFDVPLNLVTTIIPILLLTVGFAYSVHVIADYYRALDQDAAEVEAEGGPVAWALHHVAGPVLLTVLTTVVGFLSLTLSRFPTVREFGLVSVFGVITTAVLTLTFSPAILQLLGAPARRTRDGRSAADPPDSTTGWLYSLGHYSVNHRSGLLLAGSVVAVLSLWGLSRISVDTHLITNFSTQNPVRVHFEAINEHLEGARPFTIAIQTESDDSFVDPQNLRAVASLQQWLQEQPEIGGTTSFADYVRLLNRAFNDDDQEHLRIPDDPNLIKQLMLFADPDDLEDFVDSRYRNTLIKVRSNCRTTKEIGLLADRIEERLADLPEGLRGGVTGNTVVLAQSIDAIANGQIVSLSIALGFIYLVFVVLFTSFRMGLLALIPNALPILLFFGVLGLTGVPLNATTGLVACVVLGIAVDDTIHFMTRFNVEAREQADEKSGAIAALTAVGRPVTVTTIGLCLGFLVFTTGELRNQAEFGALAAFVLAAAWLVDVTITPALCSGMRIVTLWDMLNYDLGPDFQESIPIFHGLTKPQARITALLTRVEKRPRGAMLCRAGDVGDSLFVVIEGELRVSIQARDGRKVEIARAKRGDLVGEIGLYHGTRTADIEAATEVKLLRLDKDNLQRLHRRYPRIGGQVLWNLSEVMADRLAAATSREAALEGRSG